MNPVDALVLEQLSETVGDEEFLGELIRAYLADGAAQLAAMKGALEGGDAATLGRAAHSLKSNSAGVGATHLGALCAHLESLASGSQLGEAPVALGRIEREFERAAVALQRRLTSGGATDAAA